MNRSGNSLIQNLARLVYRHSDEEWTELLRVLQDDRFREKLIETIGQILAAKGSPGSRKERSLATQSLASILKHLRETDPEKSKLLDQFRSRLQGKVLLQTASALRDFGALAGMKEVLNPKRVQASSQIIRYLSEMPLDRIKQLLSREIPKRRDFGAEYEKWVALILGKSDSKNSVGKV